MSNSDVNLTTSFSFNGGNSIELLYDGLGTKLRKTVKTAGSVSLTQDYLNGIELKNNAVEAVYNEEGRAYNTGSGYRYEYVLRDHLGNTRLVLTDKDGSGSIDNSEILSESHYYPFGRKLDGAWYSDTTFSRYKYLYNGKELQAEFDLNFYDYGARWYDPGLGSWWQIDPLAEVSRRWSPYVFSNNNPLRFIDPDGMLPGDAYDQWTQAKNTEAATAEQQGLDAYSALGGQQDQISAGVNVSSLDISQSEDTTEPSETEDDPKARKKASSSSAGELAGNVNDYVVAGATTIWGMQTSYLGKANLRSLGGNISNWTGIGDASQGYQALRRTATVLKSVGSKAGSVGFVLSSVSYISQWSADPSKISIATHVNYGVFALLYGGALIAAGTVAAPVVGTAALIYGTAQLGSQILTHKTLEQHLFDKK